MPTTTASEILSSWLRNALEEAECSQSDLARAIGLTSQKVNRVLNGSRELTAEELIRISAHLNAAIPALPGAVPTQPEDLRSPDSKVLGDSKTQEAFQRQYDRAFAAVMEIEQTEFDGEMPLEDFVAALTIGLKRQKRIHKSTK